MGQVTAGDDKGTGEDVGDSARFNAAVESLLGWGGAGGVWDKTALGVGESGSTVTAVASGALLGCGRAVGVRDEAVPGGSDGMPVVVASGWFVLAGVEGDESVGVGFVVGTGVAVSVKKGRAVGEIVVPSAATAVAAFVGVNVGAGLTILVAVAVLVGVGVAVGGAVGFGVVVAVLVGVGADTVTVPPSTDVSWVLAIASVITTFWRFRVLLPEPAAAKVRIANNPVPSGPALLPKLKAPKVTFPIVLSMSSPIGWAARPVLAKKGPSSTLVTVTTAGS